MRIPASPGQTGTHDVAVECVLITLRCICPIFPFQNILGYCPTCTLSFVCSRMALAWLVAIWLSCVVFLVYVAVVGIFPTEYDCFHDLYSGWARLVETRAIVRFGHNWSTVFGTIQCYNSDNGEWESVTDNVVVPLRQCPGRSGTGESNRALATQMRQQCPLPPSLYDSSDPEGLPVIVPKSWILNTIQVTQGEGAAVQLNVVDQVAYPVAKDESNELWLALRASPHTDWVTFVPLESVMWPPSPSRVRRQSITAPSRIYARLQLAADPDQWLVAREFEPDTSESYGDIEVSMSTSYTESSPDRGPPGGEDCTRSERLARVSYPAPVGLRRRSSISDGISSTGV